MATATPPDNCTTYGYMKVPAAFYDRWALPTLGNTSGVMSVLPETRPVENQFDFSR